MANHSKNIFKILKTIDYCYINKIPINFDLNKLGITEHELGLYLHNLTEDGYIQGITVSKAMNQTYYEKYKNSQYASLTTEGMIFLEENSTMSKLLKTLKETKDWLSLIS